MIFFSEVCPAPSREVRKHDTVQREHIKSLRYFFIVKTKVGHRVVHLLYVTCRSPVPVESVWSKGQTLLGRKACDADSDKKSRDFKELT